MLADADEREIAATEVADPRAYGVLSTTDEGLLAGIVEKPADPPTNLAKVGYYAFEPDVSSAVSARSRRRSNCDRRRRREKPGSIRL